MSVQYGEVQGIAKTCMYIYIRYVYIYLFFPFVLQILHIHILYGTCIKCNNFILDLFDKQLELN